MCWDGILRNVKENVLDLGVRVKKRDNVGFSAKTECRDPSMY